MGLSELTVVLLNPPLGSWGDGGKDVMYRSYRNKASVYAPLRLCSSSSLTDPISRAVLSVWSRPLCAQGVELNKQRQVRGSNKATAETATWGKKGMLPHSSVVKKYPSLSSPVHLKVQLWEWQVWGVPVEAVPCSAVEEQVGVPEGCISLWAAAKPMHQHCSWRSCKEYWKLLWMRGRADVLINRLLKIPLHFSQDEGTVTSVFWPNSSSLFSVCLKFPLSLPLPFVLEKLSFASSLNESQVMLLAHNWSFISSWWWGNDPCGLGSLGWKRCYGNTTMFGMYTYIQRHCWLLFPSAAILEQVNRFPSCIFQLNPNHKCMCLQCVCASLSSPPPLLSWNKKNVSSPLAAIQDSPWNYKSTRQGGGKRLTLAVFISESPEKTGSAMSREWDHLREEGESLWFLSLPPETLKEWRKRVW